MAELGVLGMLSAEQQALGSGSHPQEEPAQLSTFLTEFSKVPVHRKCTQRASPVAQWRGILLPGQGPWFDPWSGKTPALQLLRLCSRVRGATLPSPCAPYRPCSSREATTMRSPLTPTRGAAPCSPQLQKSPCSNEDPAWPKINKIIFEKTHIEWSRGVWSLGEPYLTTCTKSVLHCIL